MISDCLGKPGCPFGHNAVLPKLELYNGQNVIVAVNVHLGYNQEDSLVMKRASLGRGMFRSKHIRSYKAENLWLTDILGASFPWVDALGPFEPNIHAYVWVCFTFLLLVMLFNSLLRVRSPRLGDKFLKHAWAKGCYGFLESRENFPFTIQGVFTIL
ncbi:hypothetical protein OIU78_023909 [Salix suchowensis]|nr:hypothetical protein OIU78_023909 [Salix suchowensis]